MGFPTGRSWFDSRNKVKGQFENPLSVTLCPGSLVAKILDSQSSVPSSTLGRGSVQNILKGLDSSRKEPASERLVLVYKLLCRASLGIFFKMFSKN